MGRRHLRSRIRVVLTSFALVVPLMAAGPAGSSITALASTTRLISVGGVAGFVSQAAGTDKAGILSAEFPGGGTGAMGGDSVSGSVPNSSGGQGNEGNGGIARSNPQLKLSFDALNHRQNRLASGGNQFSLEPPDQGLCVGNGVVFETINDVNRVFTTTGAALNVPTALNAFYGYQPSINRSTGVRAEFVTDPSCYFDPQTSRWFHVVLTLDTFPDGEFTGTNHLDLAVSTTANPLDPWVVYRVAVQDDGSGGTPNHGCTGIAPYGQPTVPKNPNACIGDYPHIGADANGFYITTNEYSFFGNDFHGAQIYAFSKAALAANAAVVAVSQFDTHGMDNGNSGFTLAPAEKPGGGGEPRAGGTEYFLSSNAADEAHGNGVAVGPRTSTQILVWALSNTTSLGGTPALRLNHTVVKVGRYSQAPDATQKPGNTPFIDCLNDNACATFLNGFQGPHETMSKVASNDTRMLQTTFQGGNLWGALSTSIAHDNEIVGVEYFIVRPSVEEDGTVSAHRTRTGYLSAEDNSLIFPAIGVTSEGHGVIAFTVVGEDLFPSAGYALLNSEDGAGSVHVAAKGIGPQDGFTGTILYNAPNPERPRWGDYGAAVPVGNQVWIASEYINQTCTLAQYESAPFGSCGGTRTSLANWGTRISLVKP